MQPGAWAAAAAGVGGVLALAPTVWVYLASAGCRFGVESVPPRPVAIVLGAAVWPSGPSPLLARRLRMAARLWHSGRVGAVLVSGDDRPEAGQETTTMTRFLVELGLPERVIVADPHGYRTWDTCVRAREVFGIDRAIVVTQAFHLPRTVALCRAVGVDTVGVGDPSLVRRSRSTAYGYVREVGANAKALRDAVLRPAPARTGPPGERSRLAQP
ncbi:vancomycin permeability regulator SanA [Lipingzhangella halophila]|uniref:Vancomycin permeability regulator SanA n=1 Tax=Lipingzhangella halophila TaxID=1783352 RepID=A0A7W7REA1_9ACTN|nr:ElyC/SanA/YdcF family protein [Lipingzhangella halophila]MBB4930068.1 vancomycin permeability regulator SanA [Lipingzhangella halophila]